MFSNLRMIAAGEGGRGRGAAETGPGWQGMPREVGGYMAGAV